MLLTEYDEKSHMRATYKEGYEKGEQAGYSRGEQAGYSRGEQAGYNKGERSLLERLILKKMDKGKSAAVIAEELETEIDVVEEVIDRLNAR